MTNTTRSLDGNSFSSRLSSAIVVLLVIVPIAAAIAYGAVDSAAIGLLSVLITTIVILWIAESWKRGELVYSANPLQLPLLGLIAIAIVQLLPLGVDHASQLIAVSPSNTLSMDPYATRFFLIRLAIYFLFFAVALVFIPPGDRRKRIATIIVVFGAAFAFFGILQRLATPDSIYGLRPTPQAIPFASFVNQHHFAGLMEMTSGIALGMLFGRGLKRERKVFLAIAAGIMGMAIIFTGSRGGLISYLVVIILASAASFVRRSGRKGENAELTPQRRNLLIIAAAGVLVVLVLGSVLLLGGEQSLLRGFGLQESQGDVSSGRLHFWSIAWQIFLANPIIGAGFDAFGVAFSRYDTWHGLFRVENAHNDYLQILADGGILAFACLLAFMYLFVRKGIAVVSSSNRDINRSIATGALAGCVGILAHSFFDFPLRTPANAFFFLLLVVLAVEGVTGRKRESESRRALSER